jgi:hypothetical protein
MSLDYSDNVRIAPCGEYATRQLYHPDPNVLVTRYLSPRGVAELEDLVPVERARDLIRRVRCVRGTMRFRVECEPRFDHGRDRHSTAVSADGACFRSPSLTLALRTRVPLSPTPAGVTAEFELCDGESATFVLAEAKSGDRQSVTRPPKS